jgi:hypothetical protein
MSNADLQRHVLSIARTLTDGFGDQTNDDGEPMSAYDYLNDALDIEYIISSKGEYLGARVLVAFGGPNIWIDTRRGIVDGAWWGDRAYAKFDDNIGLNDAIGELWSC